MFFIPIGGKYTMDAMEAAEFINKKEPKLVVPIHYGDASVGEGFEKQLSQGFDVKRFW